MNFFGRKKIWITLSLIVMAVIFFTECQVSPEREKPVLNNQGEAFAGTEKCLTCHREITENFYHTAHNTTSGRASETTVKGSFEEGTNFFPYNYATVVMEKRDNGLYQVLYDHNKQKLAQRIDLVIGSGTRGQTFGTWVGNKIFQLPVSYLTSADAWCNSPGYPSFEPVFSRKMTDRCLGCHGTYFKDMTKDGHPGEIDRDQIIYGVQCERCHGPGEKHVEFQQNNPGVTKGQFIINPAGFTRQQKLDLCAHCHNNKAKSLKSTFDFLPGDTLIHEVVSGTGVMNVDSQNIDVHGNQYDLLLASKCFKMTTSLNCGSCHNTHQQERGNLTLFSQRCMNCHTEARGNFCKMTDLPVSVLKTDCIDCHMPTKQSKTLTLALGGKEKNTPALLRSHLIAVYETESKKYNSLLRISGKKN